MTLQDIPSDSKLRDWLIYLQSTEVPFNYGVAAGLSILGSVVRRQRWIDQMEWEVYPNQSILFIGPSGCGKDTIINRACRTMKSTNWLSHIPVLGGVTLEAIHHQLANIGRMATDVAAAVITAPEMTAFFGKADYQQNMLTGITNILSNGKEIDVSTKGALVGGRPVVIHNPTVTMWAGSTVEWLHKAMPDGTLEGGFLGRFLIMVEELSGRHIPLVKSDKTKGDIEKLRDHERTWNAHVEEVIKSCAKPREVIIYGEAEDLYRCWYHQRFKQFSKAVAPYANRSRDMVLRLAMLMAFSRGHYRWIEEVDIQFALALIREVAQKIDAVVLPPTPEAQAARTILELLPATSAVIYHRIMQRYKAPIIRAAMELLTASGQIKSGPGGILYAREINEEGE